MTDQARLYIRRRSHSYREKPTSSDLHRQKLECIERDFDRELDRTKRELQWTKPQRSDTFSGPTEHLDNIRTRLRNNYNQLMQRKIEEVEGHMSQVHEEERRLAERKYRKAQIANEKYRLRSINEIVRERDAICEEKLAAQKNYYDRLLHEQAQRTNIEKTLQSFENLNIEQLKDRLTRVEHSNHELKQLICTLINRQPIHRNTLYIPRH